MATGLIGNLNAFDSNVETWTSYQERVEQYFLVNNIKDERKVAGLLTLLGEKTYGLLRNLTAPAKPSENSYEELCQLLQTHLCPRPLLIAERFRFHKRNQHVGESVNGYVAELRRLAEFCEFGSNLNDSLRDRFVCGLKDAAIQRKLLSIADLTLQKSIQVALAMEAACKDAAELQQSGSVDSAVHRVGKSRKSKEKFGKRTRYTDSGVKCIHCGRTNHTSEKCRLKDAVCHHCKAKGHIKSVCLKLKSVHNLEDNYDIKVINSVMKRDNGKITITPTINDVDVPMELDTGSAVTLMSSKEFRNRFRNIKLRPADSILKTYSGETIAQEGTLMVNVKYNGQSQKLKLCIVKGEGPALFGRDWLSHIKLDWDNIVHVNRVTNEDLKVRLNSILNKHKTVFSDGIGKVVGLKAKLTLKENAQPKFLKARTVPYSIKPKIEKELDNLETQGIITKVNTSEWATPIVPVVKGNGDVRLCGDFKVTVNQALQVDRYPLPRIEDIFANLSKGRKFTKLDLRQAYLQLECEDESKELLTINTHRGLYRYNRLLYGVSSAPAIWQRTMDQILQGLPGVQCILDDMVITGENDSVHLDNVQNVLCRLEQYGVKVNKDKCVFFVPRIKFCGHEINEEGLWKCKDKVESVLNTPSPHDVTSLRAYLGVLNYYHRFLPDLATVTKPMNALLEKNRKFVWSKECQNAFEKSKSLLTSEPVLTHYNPDLPVRLASDASPYGISGILSHVMTDGSEKPIAFASRSLSKTEMKYAQIDREALGIYWAVKKFYPYLYGRKFTLITDCQPLTSIFNPSKSIPATTAARVQRYALFLSGFDYDIQYKCTKRHTNVDGLSRLPAPLNEKEEEISIEDVFYNSQLEQLPVTSAEISRETKRERTLSRVYRNVQQGWNAKENDPVLKGYHARRNELSIHQGCLMWGIRVIIPVKQRERVLNLLHVSHPGIVKMKALARSYVWWPGIDADIEQMVKRCEPCQLQQKMSVKVQLHPWEWPTSSWERIHVDFIGPFLGRMFLVIVDAHSKWPEVIEMKSITASKTIEALRTIFARYGLPKQIVSDNGCQFTSDEFSLFTKRNGICHIRTAVAKPSTNGLVERFNGTFKSAMRSLNNVSDDLNLKMSSILLSYRNTPHSTTGETPAKLFFGRNLRTKLDLVKPDTQTRVTNSQMKLSMADNRKVRECELGQRVLARDFRPTSKEKWICGTIVSRDGPLLYKVDIGNGITWKRHIDQLRETEMQIRNPEQNMSVPLPLEPLLHDAVNPENTPQLVTKPMEINEYQDSDNSCQLHERRYPLRNRRPPERLQYK